MKLFRLSLMAVCLFLFSEELKAQEGNTIVFSYDESGNMTERKLQVFVEGRFGKIDSATDSILPINFKVFPNPTNTTINLEGELPADVREADVSLINVSGQVLKKDVYTGQTKSIDVSDLKNGIYFMEVKYSKQLKSSYKIIVSN